MQSLKCRRFLFLSYKLIQMRILTLLVLLLLGLQLCAQNVPAKLALSWPAGHCEYLSSKKKSCDFSLISKWDSRSFTIHGFWPSVTGSDFGKFVPSAIKSIQSQLEKYWPPRAEPLRNPKKPSFQDKYFLWIHQWEKHGKDYVKSYEFITNQKVQNFAGNQKKFQLQYFSDVLSLYKAISTKLSSNPKTKSDLARLLRIPENSFVTRCLPTGNLQEIQICYDIVKQGSKMGYKVVKCSKINSNCKGNSVNLQGYK